MVSITTIQVGNNKFTFPRRVIALTELLENDSKYGYNHICRCGEEQTMSSCINWYTKHDGVFPNQYTCKDCSRTEQFTFFGKTFNRYQEAVDYIDKNGLLRCQECGEKVQRGSIRYWIQELTKNPDKPIRCKPCDDSRKCHEYNKSTARKELQKRLNQLGWQSLARRMHKRLLNSKIDLLTEYTKWFGDYHTRNLNDPTAIELIKKFDSINVKCERYIDYILHICKYDSIDKSSRHHILPVKLFPNESSSQKLVVCSGFDHTVMHYLLALDNLESFSDTVCQRKAIFGLYARWQFKARHPNWFNKQMLKRVKILLGKL